MIRGSSFLKSNFMLRFCWGVEGPYLGIVVMIKGWRPFAFCRFCVNLYSPEDVKKDTDSIFRI